MPGRGSVPPERIAQVEVLTQQLLSRPVTAIVGLRGVPAAALQTMRRELRNRDHPMVVATNSSIGHAIERASQKRPSLRPLLAQVQDQTAILAAEGNPFSLAHEFSQTRSPTPARGGEIAPADILVPAGTTSFKPGPIVGELQHAGFPAAIEKGKVVLKKDTLIVKAGGTISREVAGLLTRMDIRPLEVGLELRALVDGDTFYPSDVLAVDLDARRADLSRASVRGPRRRARARRARSRNDLPIRDPRPPRRVGGGGRRGISYARDRAARCSRKRSARRRPSVKSQVTEGSPEVHGVREMEYVYGALLLNAAKKPIDEKGLSGVLTAAGVAPETPRLKALLASLEGVNLAELLTKAETFAAPAAAPAADSKGGKAEKKEEEKKEEKGVSEEEAAEGLSALFG